MLTLPLLTSCIISAIEIILLILNPDTIIRAITFHFKHSVRINSCDIRINAFNFVIQLHIL
jgi:hypothetical protein